MTFPLYQDMLFAQVVNMTPSQLIPDLKQHIVLSEQGISTSSPLDRPSSADGHFSRSASNDNGCQQRYDFSSFESNLQVCLSPALSADLQGPDTKSSSSLQNKFHQALFMVPSETYSHKVFIGGLAPDINEEDINSCFRHFGSMKICWPHKVQSKSNTPPLGYAFLLFKEESSVHKLLRSCWCEGEKHFSVVEYYSTKPHVVFNKKKVLISPWQLADSYYHQKDSHTIECCNAASVWGVPRTLKASELAKEITKKYGCVVFAAIECDANCKYPTGMAYVVFATIKSFIDAVSSRYMHLSRGSLEKTLELKPYILDDQMCDNCHGSQSDNKPSPFFSAKCLKYYLRIAG